MVAGKRYVLFKFAREGLRSQKVAVYSNPTIGNLAAYLVLHGAELPLLGLSAVWGLALVSGLTVNDSWEMGSTSSWMDIAVPFGPFDPATSGSSWLIPASEQLAFVMSSLCFEAENAVGLINITNTNIATDYPMGTIYYPPLPYSIPNVGFSLSTTMNGFNISTEQLSSVPSTAQNLTCVPSTFAPLQLWSDGSDNQTLSFVVVLLSPFNDDNLIFRFNATAIIMGGTLSSSGNYTEFALDGTSGPNVMPTDSQWAQDITSLICNTSSPSIGMCRTGSFSDFASQLNTNFGGYDTNDQYRYWSTVLSMALGAYSFAMFPYIGTRVSAPCTLYGTQFTSNYGIYILVLNIVASVIILIIVVRLRMASHLGADFINSTRLLLDPLEKPELFNASLKTTLDALEDPYMLVREDSAFLLAAQKSTMLMERKRWMGTFTLRRYNPFDRTSQLYRRVLSFLWLCKTVLGENNHRVLGRVNYFARSCPASSNRRVLRVHYVFSTEYGWNSTQVTLHQNPNPATPASSSATKSQKRPHLGINVDPNHGLWAFFRKKEVDGAVKHETLEARESLTESGACFVSAEFMYRSWADFLSGWVGRPWHAAELRRKSFKDLHTLWYVVLRERNLLATQREEARRMGIQNPEALAAPTMDRMCRKSMARLKFVLNERRLHYEKLSQEGTMSQEELLKVPEPPKPARRMTRRERTAARRKASSPPNTV
ncbi:mitochondrial 39-S ribosomal protein L47 (MRP-L47)-domain-containing protein [Lanmaoa asiatica]|nr:mitochondrial 39-S ribosomal protein L47 (MRP-L47)-domain-containing protein [Lanmaoa asiatica]